MSWNRIGLRVKLESEFGIVMDIEFKFEFKDKVGREFVLGSKVKL